MTRTSTTAKAFAVMAGAVIGAAIWTSTALAEHPDNGAGMLGVGAVAIGAGAGMTNDTPPWLKAINARSEALNERYGLGDHAQRRVLGNPSPDWLKALMARSDGMNRRYGLGKYAERASQQTSQPDWLVALNARSQALNKRYGLGKYAPKR